jgi:hypothetical protein
LFELTHHFKAVELTDVDHEGFSKRELIKEISPNPSFKKRGTLPLYQRGLGGFQG